MSISYDVADYYQELHHVIPKEKRSMGLVIHALQSIQREHNYLPFEELLRLSENLSIPLADIYSTASFYKHFHFKPRGKNTVCVCMGTACHVRGASKVLERFENAFNIKAGETKDDLSVTLETVGCVGCCGLAPVVTVNGKIAGSVGVQEANVIVKSLDESS